MKHVYLRLFGTASILMLCLSSCTISRIGAFFMPSVSDYKVFPTDTIFAAKHTSPAFVTAYQELPPLNTWIPAEILKSTGSNLDDFLKESRTTALLVVKNDSLIFERYANGHRKEDPQVVFSVTKGITAMLTAIAVEEGKLQLHQKVSDFIPEFAKDARKDIEVHHLLNMVSGINFDDKRDLPQLSLLYYNTNQDKFVRNYKAVSHRPGTHFAYKSIATQILSMCLEKATGMKLKDYLQVKLWEPLGMEYDALFTKDSKRHGNNRAFGGIAMRSPDMLRIGKLLLNKGKWEGKQILPESFVETLTNRQMREDRWWGYINCFWRDGYLENSFLDDNDYFAAGFHGQFIYVNPEHNIIIVRQGEKETFRWPMLFGRLVGALDGSGNDLVDMCRNYEEQFEGVYESQNGEKYEIIYKGMNPQTGEKKWLIWKDINQTLKTKKLLLAKRFDGRSIGVRRFSYVCRAIFDIENNRVVGMHFDNQRAVDMRYFIKKGEVPLEERKQLMTKK